MRKYYGRIRKEKRAARRELERMESKAENFVFFATICMSLFLAIGLIIR